jgi:hypothetical protein
MWGYDEDGNKVLLVGEDGEPLRPDEVQENIVLDDEEEEFDPMSGIAKVTNDIKA